jgi:hypothetical protein
MLTTIENRLPFMTVDCFDGQFGAAINAEVKTAANAIFFPAFIRASLFLYATRGSSVYANWAKTRHVSFYPLRGNPIANLYCRDQEGPVVLRRLYYKISKPFTKTVANILIPMDFVYDIFVLPKQSEGA